MRTLVKIGLVFPLVALLAFSFAVADEPQAQGDSTELNQDLNQDLNSRVEIDRDRSQAASDEDGTVVPEALGTSGARRGIAQRRSNRSGRGQMANANATDDRWWRGSGSSGSSKSGSSASSNSGSGDSGKSASPTDPSSDSSD